ncbi:MAG: hypothetical protein M3Y34_01020 [Actinomycetota bacterium]|nr:hypothetical protein [Actinomycetota bacterium]
MKISAKAAALAAAVALSLVPASASAQGSSETTAGSDNAPTREEARAIGRDECGEFKQNFSENRQQFGECVAAVAKVVRTDKTPRQACRAADLSRKPAEGEKRSDFSACVAAARGANGGQEA